ncbi:hypothetical protein DYB32_004458 [Aphanomyces invadans]|uniref:Protein kinase domain-containing protein n=1 Tax=Aphanomyces invadans TaxID=157072 RepID=A0A3R6Z4U1_9STRA|nr:hypothetical protein DYB32_004458 [Aphanomyces invadans]
MGLQVEYQAASIVQRTYRGHSLRKNFGNVKKVLLIRNKVRAAMKDVATGTGLILEEKDRHRAKLREQTTAAIVLQRRFRRLLATIVVAKERQMVAEERQHTSARTIQAMVRRKLAMSFARKIRIRLVESLAMHLALQVQRLYRGHVGRGVARSRRLAVQHVAVRLIQNAFTRSLAAKAWLAESERSRDTRRDRAATIVQRCFRGFLGRQRVHRIREVEAHQIALAAALSIQRVFRGRLGRFISTSRAWWRRDEVTFMSSIEITRLVRGFLGRCHARQMRLEQDTNVFVHARKGRKELVVDLLDGYGLDAPLDPNGNTVLAVASRWGHLGIVRSVIGRVKLNVENHHGYTAIMLAVKYGHADVAEYLLTKAPTLATTGRSLLHEAARNGMASTVEKLILYGMAVNHQDADFRRTPLHEAILSGHAPTIQLLIDQNVAVLDKKNQTAWRVAMAHGHENIAGDIRKKWGLMDQNEDAVAMDGGDDNDETEPVLTVDDSLNTIERLLEQGEMEIDDRDGDGYTLLMKGAMRGFYTIVRFCLRHGAAIDLVDRTGKTALMHAVAHSDIALHLIDQGANLLHTDERYVFIMSANIDVSVVFPAAGQQLTHEQVNTQGDTPVHTAIKSSNVGVLEVFLQLGYELTMVEKETGATLLHLAAEIDTESLDPRIFPTLMRAGVSVTAYDKKGWQPLHIASARAKGAVRALLANGAPVNAPSKVTNMTPYHCAAQMGIAENVQLLKESVQTCGTNCSVMGCSNSKEAPRVIHDAQRPLTANEMPATTPVGGGRSAQTSNASEIDLAYAPLQQLKKFWIDPDDCGSSRALKSSYMMTHVGYYQGHPTVIKSFAGFDKRTASVVEKERSDLIKEIRALSKLSHPNIVAFLGFTYTTVDDLKCVTEFMDGGNLRTLLNNPKRELSWRREKLSIALDVASALQYLHSLKPKVMHRNIKAEKVLLTASLSAKLSGFGSAREWSYTQTMTRKVGSVEWSAPELLLNEDYNEKIDIYAFGILREEQARAAEAVVEKLQIKQTSGSRSAVPTVVPPSIVSTGFDVPHPDFQHLAPLRNQYWIDARDCVVSRQISSSCMSTLLGHFKGDAVVVKMLNLTRPVDCVDQDRKYLVREIVMMAKLAHPNIVTFRGFTFTTQDDLKCVTEFMAGGTVRALLDKKKRALSWDSEKLRLALDVAMGLAYLHGQTPTLMHRNIKASKVLLTPGLGSVWTSQETMTAAVGTMEWAAPELLRNEDYSTPADVFSFGVFLTELDTRMIPYTDVRDKRSKSLTDDSLMMQIVMGQLRPSVSPSCPRPIQKLIQSCLQVNAAHRPAMADVVAILNQEKLMAMGL